MRHGASRPSGRKITNPATDDTVAIDVAHHLSGATGKIDELRRGAAVGRFTILRRLGAGGMGVVYAAYDPKLDRKIALKLIRATRAHDAAQVRLYREAQALAKLTHPNVVAVHDVGTHEGQVWLAMEFVLGATLGDWSREVEPSWKQVLEVIKQAASGIAAAHRVGVLHRDIKPDNIMVGDDGRVRVMDFGLARADELVAPDPVDSRSTTSSALSVELTAAGAVLGTPAYMAPEQFAGLTADARTDQYSLCTTLWEMLYGERPFSGDSVATLAIKVNAGEIKPPPARAGVPTWVRRVAERGLARDPDQRYASVEELVAALAADPRPRRRAVAVTAGVVLASVTAAVILRVQHTRAVLACEGTVSEMDAVWNASSRDAIRDGLFGTGVAYAAATAEKVTPWLDRYAETWKSARVEVCMAETVRREWEPRIAEQAETCLEEQREQARALIEQLARPEPGASGRGVVERALPATAALPGAEQCLDARRLADRPRLPTGDEARQGYRRLRSVLARSAALEAVGEYEKAMTLAEAVERDAVAQSWDSIRASALWMRGLLDRKLGNYEQAEETLESAFFLATRARADVEYASIAAELAYTVGDKRGRHEEGLRWGELATALLDRAGVQEDDVRYARVHNSVGNVYYAQGEYERASRSFQYALELRTQALGPEHPHVATSLHSLGNVHLADGAYKEAEEAYRRAITIKVQALGPNNPGVARTLNNLGAVLQIQKAYEPAMQTLQQALVIHEQALGPDHPALAEVLVNLGTVYKGQGSYEPALRSYQRALAIQEKTLGPDHAQLANSLNNIAVVYMAQGELESALRSLQRALAIQEKALGPEHPYIATVLTNIGSVLQDQGEHEAAPRSYQRALEIMEKSLGPDHPSVAHALVRLGTAYRSQGTYEAAQRSYRRALAILEKAKRPEDLSIADTLTRIGSTYIDQGGLEDARAPLERALGIYNAGKGERASIAATRFALARALWATPGQRARARELAQQSRDGYRGAEGEHGEELARIAAWLTEHGS